MHKYAEHDDFNCVFKQLFNVQIPHSFSNEEMERLIPELYVAFGLLVSFL